MHVRSTRAAGPVTLMRITVPASRRLASQAKMLAVALAALCASVLVPSLGRAATGCHDLVGLALGAHATVKSAEPVDDGVFRAPGTNPTPSSYSGLPPFCRVRGVSTPVPGSEIGFEVWLPRAKDWSRRLHMVGNEIGRAHV